MPNIRLESYQSQVRAPGASPLVSPQQVTPQMMGAGIGQGLKDLAGGVQDGFQAVEKAAVQSDVSTASIEAARARADYTKSLNEKLRSATPGDKTIADTFVADYDNTIQKVRDKLSTGAGQRAFDQSSAVLRSDLYTKANAGQAELMGVKAQSDYKGTLNHLSASLIEDPSAFPQVLQQHDATLAGLVSTGMMPADKAMELKTQMTPELAKSALRGWIRSDPDATLKDLQDPHSQWDQYINGDIKHQMFGEIKQQQSANRTEAERQQALLDQAKQERVNATQNQFLGDLSKNELTAQTVLDDPNLPAFGSGSKNQFLEMMQKQAASGGKMQKDSSVFLAYFDRINGLHGAKPLLDENELNEGVGHGLDMESLNMLRGEMQKRKTTEGMNTSKIQSSMLETAKDLITGVNSVTGVRDPEGPASYVRFMSTFLKEWDDNKKAGVSDSQMTDPNNSHYMGYKYKTYARSMEQLQGSMMNSLGGNVGSVSPFGPDAPPLTSPVGADAKLRLPGESPAQYLKRRGMR